MLRRDYNISFCKDKYIFINILLFLNLTYAVF